MRAIHARLDSAAAGFALQVYVLVTLARHDEAANRRFQEEVVRAAAGDRRGLGDRRGRRDPDGRRARRRPSSSACCSACPPAAARACSRCCASRSSSPPRRSRSSRRATERLDTLGFTGIVLTGKDEPPKTDSNAHARDDRRSRRRVADDGLERVQPARPAVAGAAREDPRRRRRARLRRARTRRADAVARRDRLGRARARLPAHRRRSPTRRRSSSCTASPPACEERALGISLVPQIARPRRRARPRGAGRRLHRVLHRPRTTRGCGRSTTASCRTCCVDYAPAPGRRTVNIDDAGAARATAEHLVSLGHRRSASSSAATSPSPTGRAARGRAPTATSRSRASRGWRAALEAAGIDWDAVPIGTADDFVRDTGRRGAAMLLDRADRPTAIIALSDELALGVLDAAAERGIDVPRRPLGRRLRRHPRGRAHHPQAHHRPPAARPQGIRSRAPAAGGRAGRIRPPPHRARRSEPRPLPLRKESSP